MKAIVAILLLSARIFANDGAAKATPAGGIQLVREARISMEKERLTIGKDRVSVEYEFLNTSDRDITTEVAFPAPAFDISSYFTSGPHDLEGWHVWVEGKELKYQTEVKAILNGVDHTALLRKRGIDIASFGHWDNSPDGTKITHDAQKLPKAQQEELRRLGLFKDDLPRWTVLKTYHWTQSFPAHKMLHVRHEYTPELGMEHLDQNAIQNDGDDIVRLSDSCLDPGTRRSLIAAAPHNRSLVGKGYISAMWVDYILTTANTWKTPIKDFELIIERPKPDAHAHYYVSLCWDGKLEKRGSEVFVSRLQNFIPKSELRVMFIPVGN